MPGSSIKAGKYSILNLKSDGRNSGDQKATLHTHNFLLSVAQPPIEEDHQM